MNLLAKETNVRTVIENLQEMGILKKVSGGLFRIDCSPPATLQHTPPGLFTAKAGPLEGLSRDDFIGRLLDDDWLYNVVFWRALDALDEEHLAWEEAPVFLREYTRKLGEF